ncbi:MAG TPA: cardiolipin synthase [Arenimonas sp.]|uniref:cardiolipin synthase n=1 Tax=Arenimonas sp. TaxID=1872635 RepID=UPI002C2B1ED5|nr:cardiolipin synthase [Arenimonas sp.]HMB58098.1 cardiolipin synthase [Arenimonas sp.]
MNELWHTLQPHFSYWLPLLWFAYLIGLGGWIVLQKREPIATVSWLLSLALLPVLGLLIYHFFGPQRIKRQRLKRLRARSLLGDGKDRKALFAEGSPLMRLAFGSSGFPPSHCQHVQLLVDGGATYDALLAAIAAASHHVHLEYYIFEPDRTGTLLRDALIERARAGVTVRLLLDALGSSHISERFLAPLRAAGVEVGFFHRIRWRLRGLWQPKLNLRSHRKIVIVDGRVGFTGGINITDDENERFNAAAYHDLHLRMDGEAVRWLQLAFLEDWTYACSRVPKDEGLWPEQDAGAIAAQVLPAGPDSPWETIHRTLLAAIGQAKRRVWLATPYFVPGEAARMALTSAALRGLDVRLLVPERSDSRLVTAAARSYFGELMAAGVRVFEYPRMLHTKALLVDDDTCVLGSSNFDNRSFRLNFELCVLFEDKGVAGALETILAGDLERAREVPHDRGIGLPQRLAEAVARLLSPLL